MVNVTKTYFPPISEFQDQVKRIWQNQWLTNRGELVQELELRLKDLLQVPFLTLTTNGTLPIQIALNHFANCGEVITTPFSYVATTSAIVWEKCTPVFVDIDPNYLTIDESKIEEAITAKTTAILATHVFGNPCNVETIRSIAEKYSLKVIYDAAHCFNVEYMGASVFNFGDVSTCSFHATKIFHTGEGGSLFCQNEELHQQLFRSHNFGHVSPQEFLGVGINAKMSELQAAMGLSVLPHINTILEERKKLVDYYDQKLDFAEIRRLKIRKGTKWNYSYYPVIFKNEKLLKKALKLLNKENIFPRRYFYPSLNTLEYIGRRKKMSVSEQISSTVLCLPLFPGLELETIDTIANVINTSK